MTSKFHLETFLEITGLKDLVDEENKYAEGVVGLFSSFMTSGSIWGGGGSVRSTKM